MHFDLSLLIVWIAFWIVNTYSEFQVNIFNNNEILQNVKKKSKLKKGHNSEKKNAFCIVCVDSIGCYLDSENIFRVSSKYLR